MRSSDHAAMSSVRSLTRPASTCCFSTPPPQVWKMSGSLPAWVSGGQLGLEGLVLQRRSCLIVTFGCAASNSLAICGKRDFTGSVVEMFHHSNVTLPSADPPSRSPPAGRVSETAVRSGPRARRKIASTRGSAAHGISGTGWGVRCRCSASKSFETLSIPCCHKLGTRAPRSRPPPTIPAQVSSWAHERRANQKLFESLRYLSRSPSCEEERS